MIFTEQDFINLFTLPNPTYEEFCNQIQVLDVMDRSGSFKVRSNLDDFVNRVSKKDDRKDRLDLYKKKLYQILVTDADKNLKYWFARQGALPESLDFYFDIPRAKILDNKIFSGRTNSKYGKLCKNINFVNYYNTKKLWSTDSEYAFGLLKVMVEEFKIRNSLVGPAFFDQICRYEGDPADFWHAFMMGANRPSTFNPATYRSILDELFTGKKLFAPVMGWNAYQLAFYSSKFTEFVATDVIPNVVNNGNLLQQEYLNYAEASPWELPEKNIELYLCPSEQLEQQHDFVNKHKDSVDAVLFSPPYFDLEIYDSEDQSFTNYPDYNVWLEKYWATTVELCSRVMKPGAKFGFVISNYVNKHKQMTTISQDMKQVADRYLKFSDHYKVQWSAIASSRQSHKTRSGNYEDLWLFVK
jgi:hypothetical protein